MAVVTKDHMVRAGVRAHLEETERAAVARRIFTYTNFDPRFMSKVDSYPADETSLTIGAELRKALESEPTPKPNAQEHRIMNPGQDPCVQDYQEALNRLIPSGVVGDGQAVELARFKVSHNAVGVVKGIWIHADISRPGISSSGSPFDPLTFARVGANVRFHLRLVQTPAGVEPPWFFGPWQQIPGYGYFGIPYWDDNRFPWSHSGDVFFIVPGGFHLRLFGHGVRGSDQVMSWFARMWGFTQSAYRYETEDNVRRGWR